MASLSIGVDDRWNEGGIGRFSREVQSRLPSKGGVLKKLGVTVALANPFSPLAIGQAIRLAQSDVFWSPGFMPPTRCHTPVVLTIHDLIHRRYGGYARRQYYDYCIRPLVRRAQTILTVSHYSRNEIVKWLGDSCCDVQVVGNGVSDVFCPDGASLDLESPYLLYAGNFRRHKNIERLLEAFASSRVSREMFLAFTGTEDKQVMQWADRCHVGHRVKFLGEMDEMALAAAYRGARAVLQISLEEGFGLPVIEAMACGAPVVCSATTALGEVAGDAAMLVDPLDIGAIALAMEHVCCDEGLQSNLRMLGLRRAADFSWDDVASRTFEALKQAAAA